LTIFIEVQQGAALDLATPNPMLEEEATLTEEEMSIASSSLEHHRVLARAVLTLTQIKTAQKPAELTTRMGALILRIQTLT